MELARFLGFKTEKGSKTKTFEHEPSSTMSIEYEGIAEYDYETELLYYTADYISDLNAGIHSMFIYTDIIRETLVGNTFSPLLRNINVVPKRDIYIQRSFDRVHYMKLNSNRINNIEIKICNSLGELIKFYFGDVIIKIHFRRRRI